MSEVETHLEGLIDKGEIARAYADARAINGGGKGTELTRYLEVLALARMGATRQAGEAFVAYGLDTSADGQSLAMAARLTKDRALDLEGEERQTVLREAAELYRQAFLASEDYFPLVNAASLLAAAGDREKAAVLAQQVLTHADVRQAADYWSAATAVEALLVTGQTGEALEATYGAISYKPLAGSRSTTVNQFIRLFAPAGIGGDTLDAILAILRPAPVYHFCGHRLLDGPQAEAHLASQIAAVFEERGITAGYGALASGADILVAEAILEAGGELHVVLPFAKADFIAQSVAPAGQDWVHRFESCLARATEVVKASDSGFVGDPSQFDFGSKVAMGLARLRASHLAALPLQLALWDGKGTSHAAGTAKDVASWAAVGCETVIIETRRPAARGTPSPALPPPRFSRDTHAVLFADVSGFSKLSEADLAEFWESFTSATARVLSDNRETILCANTWGDALYLVVNDPVTAAAIAQRLVSLWSSSDNGTAPEIDRGAIRIALHFGPMFRVDDPITGGPNYIGVEVSRTARLEPVTPRNSIYVTQPFAAVLSIAGASEYRLIYCGDIDYAKGYGSQAAYLMHKQNSAGDGRD